MRHIYRMLALWCVAVAAIAQPFVLDARATQATYLQITNGSYIQEAQVFATCARLKPGQVVSVHYQAEVTNPNGYNVGIGSVLRAWDYNVDATGNSVFVRNYNAVPPVMTNVTPDMHHLVARGSIADTVSYALSGNTRCYTLVLWGVASGGAGIINVEQGYGFLQVLVH